MNKTKRFLFLLTAIFIMALLVACGGESMETAGTEAADSSQTTTTATTTIINNVAEGVAENSQSHEAADDYLWDSSQEVSIQLNGDSIAVTGEGVTVGDSTATIVAAGTYHLRGSLTNGQIVVDAAGDGLVQLILDGVDLSNQSTAPLEVRNAEKVVIILADDSQNFVTDGENYLFADAETDEPNGAIFSKADLTIAGNGSLTVVGNYNDGIASKDGLIVAGGNITVNAADDGLRGKDYVLIEGGRLAVTAGGDGLKADNEEEADKGYILVTGGEVGVISGRDALEAATDILIQDGQFNLLSGGGSQAVLSEDSSAKGIKAGVSLTIDAGLFSIDSADDALHSDANLVINGGTFTIATGDDGLHAESALVINDGEIAITQSYEGIEGKVITLNDGNIRLVASDDGLNVVSEGSSGGNGGPGGGGPGGGPGGGGGAAASDNYFYMNGGYLVVETTGDGLDVNGSVEMSGGVVIVNGPTERMNGALDYDGWFHISGGLVVAAGSAGMAQAPDQDSSQHSLLVNFETTYPAGTLIHIQSEDGTNLLTFAPTKAYQSIALSSPDLQEGTTYQIFVGGSSTGTVTDGLYQGGSYQGGEVYASFTVSNIVTQIGNTSFRP